MKGAQWLVGFGALAVILYMGTEFDSTRELTAAFAILIAGSVAFLYLPQAAANLNSLERSK